MSKDFHKLLMTEDRFYARYYRNKLVKFRLQALRDEGFSTSEAVAILANRFGLSERSIYRAIRITGGSRGLSTAEE